MNKNIKRILTLALVMVMVAVMIIPAMAATGGSPQKDADTGETYLGTNQSTAAKITKYVVVDNQQTEIPGITFTFEITSEDPSGTVDLGWDQYPGAEPNNVTIGEATFVTGQDLAAGTGIPAIGAGKYYATNQADIFVDFANVTFSKPGVYYYKLTESSVSAAGYTRDDTEYHLAVYVEYALLSDGNYATSPSIAAIIVTKTDPKQPDAPAEPAGKVGGKTNDPAGNSGIEFFNVYKAGTLNVTKTVSGNQGDRSKEFYFEITLEGLSAPTDSGAVSYPYTITGGTSGTVTIDPTDPTKGYIQNLKLMHNQTITIDLLPPNVKYTIKETAVEGYTTTSTTDGGGESKVEASNNNGLTATGVVGAATTVVYTNEKNGAIPTGILMTIAPFALLMIVGVVGVAVILKKRSN